LESARPTIWKIRSGTIATATTRWTERRQDRKPCTSGSVMGGVADSRDARSASVTSRASM
jgi:hypothetical protein